MTWVKSSRNGTAGECVEVQAAHGEVHVRDSKDPDGPVLVFSAADWQTHVLDEIRAGGWLPEHGYWEADDAETAVVLRRQPDGLALRLTGAEWDAFIAAETPSEQRATNAPGAQATGRRVHLESAIVRAGSRNHSELPHSCRCGARWSGYETAHCGATCHRTFSGVRPFSDHRREGRCTDPADIGMTLVPGRAYECWGYTSTASDD